MKLDVLVYADRPADRMVFVNGRKYTEGQRTEEGAVIEEITPDGALISHDGRRFLLRGR
ncbi:MAG: general secretion pathway protein GspB [Candidatus Rokubacteria bacterium]|nr:general secretion pathway protein GspB [Candidatus Rokubacteria bacterium]